MCRRKVGGRGRKRERRERHAFLGGRVLLLFEGIVREGGEF